MKSKITIFVMILGCCMAAGFLGDATGRNYTEAIDLLAMFNENHIKFYEEELAKESVVSHIPADKLTKMAREHGMLPSKLKKLIVLQHALKTAGREISIDELSKMSGNDMMDEAKIYVTYLRKVYSKEELKEIGRRFKDAGRQSLEQTST